jgi:hypothetical protein
MLVTSAMEKYFFFLELRSTGLDALTVLLGNFDWDFFFLLAGLKKTRRDHKSGLSAEMLQSRQGSANIQR